MGDLVAVDVGKQPQPRLVLHRLTLLLILSDGARHRLHHAGTNDAELLVDRRHQRPAAEPKGLELTKPVAYSSACLLGVSSRGRLPLECWAMMCMSSAMAPARGSPLPYWLHSFVDKGAQSLADLC